MKSIISAAVIGVLVFVITLIFPSEEKGLNIQNMVPLFYAVFICLWGSVFD